jgi:hypothetical protein
MLIEARGSGKSTSTARSDAKNLAWLKTQLGDRFNFGAVLDAGDIAFEIEEHIWAIPMSTLWSQ